ncbi:hypothetical protein C8F01DRAFT_1098878 [Mycena amicta]|nr:hypothetical protein C8F01DRAFT_1098878 [Mycena amicta]
MLSKYLRDDDDYSKLFTLVLTSSRTTTWSRETLGWLQMCRCLRCYDLGTHLFTHHRFQQARRVQHRARRPLCRSRLIHRCQLFISLTYDQSHSLVIMTSTLSDNPCMILFVRALLGRPLAYALSHIFLLARTLKSNATSLCCSAACLNERNLHYIVHLYPYALAIPSFFLFCLRRLSVYRV